MLNFQVAILVTGPAIEPAIVWARLNPCAVRQLDALDFTLFPVRTSYLLILSSTAVVGRIRASVLKNESSSVYDLFPGLFLALC